MNYTVKSEYIERFNKTITFLDANPCPHCGSVCINADIISQAQFVETSGKTKERFTKNIENTLFHPDDGPHSHTIDFAMCANCGRTLIE